MIDERKRSLTKTISWRLLATLDTIVIVFILTRNFSISVSIGGIEIFTKLILYYFHERVWSKIFWGKKAI